MSFILTAAIYFLLCMVLFHAVHLAGERLKVQGAIEWNFLFLLAGAVAYVGLRLLTGNTLDPITAFVCAVVAFSLYDWLQS